MVSFTIKDTICLLALLLLATITSAYDCPEHCACITVQRQHSSYNHAKCTSLNGLRRIGRTATIQSLDCSGIGIAKLTNQLDKLTNLTQLDLSNNQLSELTGLRRRIETLNLSHNRIPSGKLTKIPSLVQHLNLSHNDITYIPLDFKKLLHLRTLELNGNPINCTCDTLDVRNWLNEKNVFMGHVVKCASPLNLKGKPWLQVRQSDVCQHVDDTENELMLGDQPVFDSEGPAAELNENSNELESDFMLLKNEKSAEHVVTETIDTHDGVEGSGDVDIDVSLPLHSDENTMAPADIQLTTMPSPIIEPRMALHDTNDTTSPSEPDYDDDDEGSGSGGGVLFIPSISPRIVQDVNNSSDEDYDDLMLTNAHDLGIFGNVNGSDVSLGIQQSDEQPTTMAQLPIEETVAPPIVIADVESIRPIEDITENKSEISMPVVPPPDVDATNTIAQESQPEQGQSTMILLIILGVVLVGLLAFIIVKKRRTNSRNRREKRDEEAPAGTELLDMDKNKPGKSIGNDRNGNGEFIPLMGNKPAANGHQKPSDDLSKAQEPLLKKLEEPHMEADGLDSKQPEDHNDSADHQLPVVERPNVAESNNNNVVQTEPPQRPGRSPVPPYRRKQTDQAPAIHNQYNGHPPTDGDDDEVFAPVSPRQGRYSPVYSPDTGRVKIKLAEMPKPKTPMLVTRSRSNAGDIILTPDLNQSRRQ